MIAKLIFVNVPSSNISAARRFYETLLGSSFGSVLSDNIQAVQQVISSDGIGLNISQRYNPNESVAAHFAVDNLEQAIQGLEAVGAQVVVPPFDLPVSAAESKAYVHEWQQKEPNQPAQADAGRAALVRDPDGNLVGLAQLSYAAQRQYRAGQFRQSLDPEQNEANRRAQQLHKA